MKTKSTYLFLILLLASILAACSAPAPASNSTSADRATIAIVQGFWDAINAKNFDAAMAFVADDVKITGLQFNGSEDKAQFAAFMSSGVLTYKISDLRVSSGGTVTLNLTTYNSIGYMQASGTSKFQVNNEGKIFLIKFPNAY